MLESRSPRELACRFAAGKESHALSGVWRVWVARNKPDLYVAIRSLGQIKATVHCPWADKPTWKRHFGFDRNAQGEVAEAVLAHGSRHRLTWAGAKLAEHCTLEWRVYIPGTALRKTPLPVSSDVALISPPREDQCLIVMVILGPAIPTSGHPRAKDQETHLLAEGRLRDGRRVWVTYCYAPRDAITFREPQKLRGHISADALHSAPDELRGFAVLSSDDGSLGFLDMRVERKQPPG